MSPSNAIHFAQIREDAHVERTVFQEASARRLAVVASGGCTALSLLTDDVEVVFAVDASPAQIALVALRKAAMEALDRQGYLTFVGDAEAEPGFRAATYRHLRSGLDAPSRLFWDARVDVVELGIQSCGTTERFYRFLGGNLRTSVLTETAWEALWGCRTVELQAEWADRYARSDVWRMALRVLLSRTSHMAFFPEAMFANAREHHFGDFFAAQFDRELRSRSVSDNPFLHQVLYGRYRWDLGEAAPPYLTERGYAEARRNLHKLRLIPAPLQALPAEVRDVDGWGLSNVFDWADAAGADAIAASVLARSASRGAAVVARRMLADGPLPEALDRGDALPVDAADRSMLYRTVLARRVQA